MQGRMFKVGILLDNDKILKEDKYPIKDIYYTIEKTYAENGFVRDVDTPDGEMFFYGTNGWSDLDGMSRASFFLDRADWFMRYVKRWTHYENEQCNYQDEFCEVDVLAMKKKVWKTVGVI
jgi:hypothetical protein